MNFKYLLGISLATVTLIGGSTVDAAMTYNQALTYQQKYPEEIQAVSHKIKDAYGQKTVNRYFSFLGKNGLMHTGSSAMGGQAHRTLLNLAINYGPETQNHEPFAYIRWSADLKGAPDNGYAPKVLHVAYEDGFIKSFNLQGWEYRKVIMPGIFMASWAYNYDGRIQLNEFDLYELTTHGKVAAVSINTGVPDGAPDNIQHFFYAGDKDKDKKDLFDKGLVHSLNILQIDKETLKQKAEVLLAQQEADRKAQLRAEIEKEIKAEQEREAMKKQILEEMRLKEEAAKAK